ncbi:dihydrodipicolinate synthase family protein [Amycolatopsis samaneae]|uniref:Dihydrodipicolinate synthase family protein n=1 Tax=Amycolatopsis samaneae TaxID=664691 RepID=A0ABW5GMF3_9PSEU
MDAVELLRSGLVIPAHPLALTEDRRLDERRQRALTRYYLDAGAGGVAVAVHTTQFEIRQAGLLAPVLELAAETVRAEAGRPVVRIAGSCGPLAQAVAEAELAASLGYDAVLLSPAVPDAREEDLLVRAKAVGEVLPVVGFSLQRAIGGPALSLAFWRRFAEIPAVVAIKAAPFDRYRTLDVARAIAESGRAAEIALYTGNDDAIIADLLATYRYGDVELRTAGGLLGQWAVWTHAAVALHRDVRRAREGDTAVLTDLLGQAAELTDANAAVFDAANGFAGCIAGVHEVLRRQGLLAGTWCLDPDEGLSPGQAGELTRVTAAYPWLTDDTFVAEHLDRWLS